MRLKVVFAPGLVAEESRRAWFAVPPSLLTVSDLARELARHFDSSASPASLRLSCDGFALPPISDISLVRDGDMIEVRAEDSRKREVADTPEAAETAEPRKRRRHHKRVSSATVTEEQEQQQEAVTVAAATAVAPVAHISPAKPAKKTVVAQEEEKSGGEDEDMAPAEKVQQPRQISSETTPKDKPEKLSQVALPVPAPAPVLPTVPSIIPGQRQPPKPVSQQKPVQKDQPIPKSTVAVPPTVEPPVQQKGGPDAKAVMAAKKSGLIGDVSMTDVVSKSGQQERRPSAAVIQGQATEKRKEAQIIPAQIGKKIVFNEDGDMEEVEVEREVVVTGKKSNKRNRYSEGTSLQQEIVPQQEEPQGDGRRRRQRRQRQRLSVDPDTQQQNTQEVQTVQDNVVAVPALLSADNSVHQKAQGHELTASSILLTATAPPPSIPAFKLTFPREYEKFPPLKKLPDIGDIIAYKILELSQQFTPEISDWKEAKILNVDTVEGSMTMEVILELNKPKLQEEDAGAVRLLSSVVSAKLAELVTPHILQSSDEQKHDSGALPTIAPVSAAAAAAAAAPEVVLLSPPTPPVSVQQRGAQSTTPSKSGKVWKPRGLGRLVAQLRRQSAGELQASHDEEHETD